MTMKPMDVNQMREKLPPDARKALTTLPDYMIGGLLRYLFYGLEPGHFLAAVLKNDLCGSLAKADEVNRDKLFAYVSFLYSHAPFGSWGSPERYQAWLERGGIIGNQDDKTD